MNKYLLLRDNKQTGPYSVQEIVSMGIKPYDLVWLEGKSAAWRYPSEIEELKEYAPAVEEQPFDRFYKKPEAVSATGNEITHDRFAPKISESAAPVKEEAAASKKIYINFPGGAGKADVQKAAPPSAKPVAAEKIEVPYEEPVVSHIPSRSTRTFTKDGTDQLKNMDEPTVKDTRKQEPGRRILYAGMAACLILVMFTGVLVVNYYNQRNSLAHLNTLVQQMEERQKQARVIIPAAVTQPVAEQAPAEPVPDNTDRATDNNLAGNSEPAPVKTAPVKKAASDNDGLVFKAAAPPKASAGTLPAEHVENAPAAPKNISAENLYKLVSVKPSKFKTGLLGGISNLQIELTNNSGVELHRVAVEIHFLGPEKKVVNTQTLYFENVAPGAQTTIDVPRSNRGVTIDYTITDIKS